MMTFRKLFLFGLIVALGLVGSAYFLEYYFHLDPCPLCHLQRYVLFAIIMFFFLGIVNTWGYVAKLFFSGSNIFFSLLGILLALRHVWLQYSATVEGVTTGCTAGLERLLQFQPLMTVLKEVLINSESCSKIDFTILKLPLSVWSLLSFILIFAYSCFIFQSTTKRRV